MKRAVALVFVLAAFLLGDPSAMAQPKSNADSISGRQFTGQASTDTVPVHICIDGECFEIPRNYLQIARLTNVRGEKATALFVVKTAFQAFQGATAETLSEYQSASIEGNAVALYTLGPKSELFRINDRNASAINEAQQNQKVEKYGLIKVKAAVSLAPKDVYVDLLGNRSDPVVIGCPRPDHPQPPFHCLVYFEKLGLPFFYAYDMNLLPHWAKIHEGILGLLEKFRSARSP